MYFSARSTFGSPFTSQENFFKLMLKLEALVTTRTRTAAGFAAPTMVRGRSRAEAH